MLEAMAAAAVLGIGLYATVRLETRTIQGVTNVERFSSALVVASQVADRYATQGANVLPTCPVAGTFTADTGCAEAGAFTADRPNDCTLYGRDRVPDKNGDLVDAVTTGREGDFRVDVAVDAHPNVSAHPDARVIQVWVCWRDQGGIVKEVSTRRVLLGGV